MDHDCMSLKSDKYWCLCGKSTISSSLKEKLPNYPCYQEKEFLKFVLPTNEVISCYYNEKNPQIVNIIGLLGCLGEKIDFSRVFTF